jgi:hypothetical protein
MSGEELARRAARLARRDPDDGPTGEEAWREALEWISEGQAALLSTDDPWDFLERSGWIELIAGADTYALLDFQTALGIPDPGIERVLQMVNDSDGGVLAPLTWQTQENLARSTQANPQDSTPETWAPIGPDKVRLWPRPDTNTQLGLLVRLAVPATLAATAEPMLPEAFQSKVLVSYGAMRMWEQWAGADARLEAERQLGRYQQAVQELRLAHGVARFPNIVFWEGEDEANQRSFGVAW